MSCSKEKKKNLQQPPSSSLLFLLIVASLSSNSFFLFSFLHIFSFLLSPAPSPSPCSFSYLFPLFSNLFLLPLPASASLFLPSAPPFSSSFYFLPAPFLTFPAAPSFYPRSMAWHQEMKGNWSSPTCPPHPSWKGKWRRTNPPVALSRPAEKKRHAGSLIHPPLPPSGQLAHTTTPLPPAEPVGLHPPLPTGDRPGCAN